MTTSLVDVGNGVTDGALSPRQRPWVTFVLAVALLGAAFVSSPLHLPLNNPNEGVRVFATRALVPLVRLAERPRPTLVIPSNIDFPEDA